jgi:hypothetical protein
MRGSMSEEQDDSSQLIGWGGDLLAGLAAAHMAIAHAGPAGLYEGAMIGSTLALSFRNIVPLFFGRAMARREQERVGTVSVLTAVAIRKRLDAGEQLREDGFFERDATDRSEADEIARRFLSPRKESTRRGSSHTWPTCLRPSPSTAQLTPPWPTTRSGSPARSPTGNSASCPWR